MADPFRVWIRNDRQKGAFDLRFEMNEGLGGFVLRRAGQKDEEPSHHGDVEGVALDLMRAGRFVHQLGTGQKHQYAFARVPADSDTRLGADWVELVALTEHGFRYLIVPDGDMTPAKVAAVQVGPSSGGGSRGPTAARTTLPPGPGGFPNVAGALPRDRAADALVRALHDVQQRIAELEGALAASRAREAQLMALLQQATGR
jgi:hypothetical protein